MQDTTLLQQALAITPSWSVIGSDFDPLARRLDIRIDFAAGSRFLCPVCAAAECPAYDTEQMTWRHLNFFQHQARLHARVRHHYVERARARTDISTMARAALDETAARRGHNYVTLSFLQNSRQIAGDFPQNPQPSVEFAGLKRFPAGQAGRGLLFYPFPASR